MQIARLSSLLGVICLVASACAASAKPSISSGELTVYPLSPVPQSTRLMEAAALPAQKDGAKSIEFVGGSGGPQYPANFYGCNVNECLFYMPNVSNSIMGFAKIRGYYVQQMKKGLGEQTGKCDSFVILLAPSMLTANYKSQANGEIYTLNNENQIVVSLDMTALNQTDKQKILASSQKSPVDLNVISVGYSPKSGLLCYSPLSIVDVK